MRLMGMLGAVALSAAFSTQAISGDAAAHAPWGSDQQATIDLAVAPIKSRADLVRHLREVRDSPLWRLPDPNRREFLASLTFTQKGLASYSHLPLADALSVTDTYRLLALFGLQSTISGVQAQTPVGEIESAMQGSVSPFAEAPKWVHSVCVIHGRVRECRPHYGYNCSRACDD